MRIGRKGLKEAKTAVPARMCTTIGSRRGKTQEEAGGGILGGIGCGSHQESRILALPLQENGAEKHRAEGPFVWKFVLNFKTPEWR